ncbi:MAG: FAD-dependent thymidylate synthase, partial [Actinobacteria bacterium]|nr:FAD-dependent thymidylate synthase [Actinomycetota bacterium]
DSGVEAEDARYILPNASETKIIVTMDGRELLHFFTVRCCNRAQWEIRELAKEMLKLVRKVAPVVFEEAGPNCLRGPCPEGKFKCENPPKASDFDV